MKSAKYRDRYIASRRNSIRRELRENAEQLAENPEAETFLWEESKKTGAVTLDEYLAELQRFARKS